jgi:site-specific DNA-methyltransferase (adenine-specific)
MAANAVQSQQRGREVFRIGSTELWLRDALDGMRELPDNSFDLAIADPPYGAATRQTVSLPHDHSLPGFGGAWKLADHDWDRLVGIDGFRFTVEWLAEIKRLVRPTGSAWIHATYHNSGFVNVACQLLGLEIINEVIWFKRNAFPNLSGRRLTASHESMLWVHTGGKQREYAFNYDAACAAAFAEDAFKEPGKQLRTVWDIPNNKRRDELEFGRHPTQKPLRVTRRIFLIAGRQGGSVLVPFAGSGTELVAAMEYGMSATGYEIDAESFALAVARTSAMAPGLQIA